MSLLGGLLRASEARSSTGMPSGSSASPIRSWDGLGLARRAQESGASSVQPLRSLTRRGLTGRALSAVCPRVPSLSHYPALTQPLMRRQLGTANRVVTV